MRRVVRALSRVEGLGDPAMTRVAARKRDPFAVLVGTVISLRTRDEVTLPAADRLLALAPRVEDLARLSPERIQRVIYPAGFYRTKGRTLRRIARILLERHGGRVPDRMEDLLLLPGVGRKTANLVLLLGHGIPALCVDTHVHRISNRLGFVSTRTPDRTETILRERLPAELWFSYNELLVRYGKRICTPLSPRCSACAVVTDCPRIGVARSR
ncbi:MAG: endonuclease III [Candidatus Eisenbacteria bacterium]|nr:endonuclease III [Candidatus Latescibacterota bacterium]MBD3301375.1 endonuclease III [Candidatus Eisenbacteria bacterium]